MEDLKVIAYGFDIKQTEYELIRNIIHILGDTRLEIYDLKSYSLSGEQDAIIFTFGKKAAMYVIEAAQHIELPDLIYLDPSHGDEKIRKDVYDKLLNLRKRLDSSGRLQQITKIDEESLPNLTADDVKQLELKLREKGIHYWRAVTRGGKVVIVSNDISLGVEADVQISFPELYSMKILMETLQVKELEIVHNPSRSK